MNDQTHHIAAHLRQIHTGGNWTSVNLRDTLHDVSFEQAKRRLADCHTILELLYHVTYYVNVVTVVLQGGALDASDAVAYDHPPVDSEEQWRDMVNRSVAAGETMATLVERLDDDVLDHVFVAKQYGSYRRNLVGIIEHMHYHLGQMVILKKLM